MEAVFWGAAALVAYAYLGYPALIAFAAWLRPAPRAQPGERRPSASLVIVAHNEEACLQEKLANVLALDYPRGLLEVWVVSDGSSDRTAAIARSFEAEGVRLAELPGPNGKAAALNAAVPRTRGEILVLSDARQRLAPDALLRLAAYFADPDVGAVSGELQLEAAGQAPAAGFAAYWSYEKLLRRAESRFDSTVGATGALYALRRELWRELDPRTILDDVAVPMAIVLLGRRVLFAPEARAYDRVAPSPGHEYRRKVRTLAGNYQLLALMPALLDPRRNRLLWQFVSHKLLRLAVPFCLPVLLLGGGFLAARGGAGYAALFAAQLILYLLAAAGAVLARGGRAPRALALPFAFVLGNLAAAQALLVVLRGRANPAWRASA